jgi:hypothetical protein
MERNTDRVRVEVTKRYGSLAILKLAIWEDEDTVLVNLADDLNYDIEENDLLTIIKDLLR